MSDKDTGGPAFPQAIARHHATEYHHGMSILDYFMAHAPVEPQPWFTPDMPPEPTQGAYVFEDGYTMLHLLDAKNREREKGISFVDSSAKQKQEWTIAFKKQRYIQWPRAWADEMLRERAK
jgi:hypothetical protein